MRTYLKFAICYFMVAVGLVIIIQPDPEYVLLGAAAKSLVLIEDFLSYLPILAVVFLVLIFIRGRENIRKRLTIIVFAAVSAIMISTAFSVIKTMIPLIQPFYADPFFIELDRALHGGVDPWVWTHRFSDWITPEIVAKLYFLIWSIPAVFLPVVIAATDDDADRSRRFLILHSTALILLGNILAMLGASVGPVYYDRLAGGDTFAPLLDALRHSGITTSGIGVLQQNLWTMYSSDETVIGSGISAFPSVHVGMASVAMFYLAERSRLLLPFGLAYLGAIQFCSVYIGWHYAVDGYFSFLVVAAVWFGLRAFGAKQRRKVAIVGHNPA